MARKASVELEGFDALSEAFNELEKGVQDKILKPALEECAEVIAAAARAKAPVRTGNLRNTIRVEPMRKRRGSVGFRIRTGYREELGIPKDHIDRRGRYIRYGYYPFVIEYGGVRGGTKTDREWLRTSVSKRGYIYARKNVTTIVTGGRRIPARPFWRPAVDENRTRCLGILAARLQEGLDRVVTSNTGKQRLATPGASDAG